VPVRCNVAARIGGLDKTSQRGGRFGQSWEIPLAERAQASVEFRRMPRMAVEKDYRFEGPNGPVGLLDLFEGAAVS
jgi:Bacterial protein of unknown function (DUF899)